MDVTQERQVQDLANTVIARFERVDVLINNAGVFARGSFADTPASVRASATRLQTDLV